MSTVRNTVLDELGRIAPEVEIEAIDPARPLREQVDLDSMDWLRFLTAVSRSLAIEIPDRAARRLATVDALCGFLEARLQPEAR